MPSQPSILASHTSAIRAAEAALAKAQGHLEECRARAADATKAHDEFTELVKGHAEECPFIEKNFMGHEYLTKMDLGGGKNPQNCGRHFCLVRRLSCPSNSDSIFTVHCSSASKVAVLQSPIPH